MPLIEPVLPLYDRCLAELVSQLQAASSDEDVSVHRIIPIEWTPLPGPQTQGYDSQADILYFGGAAGGGKSEMLLGLAGQVHRKSIIFRREFPQMAELRERSRQLFRSRGRFNGQEQVWHLDDGRLVEFGAVQIERFMEKYQGRPHDLICVGRGTPVRMRNGSYKPVECICTGDMVSTLEGPRRVTRILPIQAKAAVLATFSVGGRIVAQQIQGANHEVLTTSGWVSHDTLHEFRPTSACESTELFDDYRSGKWSSWKHVAVPLRLSATAWDRRRHQGHFELRLGHQWNEDLSAAGVWLDQENDSEAFVYRTLRDEQHFLGIDLPRHLQPILVLRESSSYLHSVLSYGVADGPPWSSQLDYRDDYLCGLHRHDGHAHQGAVVALLCPQPRDDAARQTPKYFLGDDLAGIHGRSHYRYEYPHPYTKETRSTEDLLWPCEVTFEPLGEMELFDLTVESANHYITGTAGIVNKNCFDEVAHFLESQFRFLNGWLRTTTPGQRCRIVATGNPPTSAEGEWIIQYWGPWLDPQHPYPALPGELRWYATVDGKDVERQDGTPFEHKGEILTPMSRTFIPSRVEDNPYLMASGYKTVLQNLPEPLRSKMLHGDFSAGLEDNPWQVIPTAWVDAAMKRWTDERPDVPLSALGVDVARGGKDQTTIARRYGPWFAPLKKYPGLQTPDGPSVSALVILEHEGDAPINIDIIGVGGSGYDYVKGVKPHCTVPMNGAEKSTARDRSGQLHFRNKRAEWHWKLREALDPVNGDSLALPPDREMRADLIAPRWKLSAQGIQIEEKDEIKARLGRSPDCGEAIIYAHAIDSRRKWLPVGDW